MLGQQSNNIQQLLGLGGLGVQQQNNLGQLGLGEQGQQIGANQFMNQFGLAGNQQEFNQQIAPAMQLLQSLFGFLGPTGMQTVAAGR